MAKPSFTDEPIIPQPRPMIFDTGIDADDWLAANAKQLTAEMRRPGTIGAYLFPDPLGVPANTQRAM
jgi:hypothetical protein